MKKLLIFILLLPLLATATNYYVSNAGNDAAAGTSTGASWQTISKVNSFFSSLSPGDSVLFKRGDTFTGTLVISRSGSSGSPIIISSYGTGAKPVFNGFTTVSAWTSIGGGVYESTSAATTLQDIKMVTFNGALQPMGRWPKVDSANTGYLLYQSHSGNASITSNQIATAASFVGGEVVIRKYDWVLDRGRVTAQTSTTVTYGQIKQSASSFLYSPQNGWGFFFQNHVNACTRLGEWAFDSTTKKLRMYFGGASPGSYTVKASTTDSLVNLQSNSYITFDNLSITGANTRAFQLNLCNNIQINNCDISFSGVTAIEVFNDNTNATRIYNCTISNTNNDAITGGTSVGWTIQNNTITNSGMNRGMGLSSAGNYEALSYIGGKSLIEYNVIRNTGYNGINFRGDSTIVNKNFVDSFCMILQDGGGIYTYLETAAFGRKVTNNIVHYSLGAYAGAAPGGGPNSHGLYVDGGARNIDITGNTVADCSFGGLHLNYPQNINIQNNTFYNNGEGLTNSTAGFYILNDNTPMTGITIKHNILVARRAEQLLIHTYNTTNDISSWGTVDSNYYCRPISEPSGINDPGYGNGFPWNNGGIIFAEIGASDKFYSLDVWQTVTGVDAHTLKTYATVSDTSKIRFEYNPTNSTLPVSLGGYSYKDVAGTSYQGTINLAPYSSIILFNPVTPTVNSTILKGKRFKTQ